MNKTVSITSLPSATGFGPGDSLVGIRNGKTSLFPYDLITTGATGSGATGATGATGISDIQGGDLLREGGIVVANWIENGQEKGLVMSLEDLKYGNFGWTDLSDVTTRSYSSFRSSNANRIGENVLIQDFVMRETTTNRYWKMRFSKWTEEGGNGGGFEYTRTEINSSGVEIGPSVTFEKTNFGSEIDVIIPDVLSITRDNNGPIYNEIIGRTDTNIDPVNTEWNSEISSKVFVWSNIDNEEIGISAQSFNNGLANTLSIISQEGHDISASKVSREYDGGGYDDWFLPSLNQIRQTSRNIYILNKILVGNGYSEISNEYYWTSTEESSNYAYGYNIIRDDEDDDNKSDLLKVRPFREF